MPFSSITFQALFYFFVTYNSQFVFAWIFLLGESFDPKLMLKNSSLKNNAIEVERLVDEEIDGRKGEWKRAKDDVSF